MQKITIGAAVYGPFSQVWTYGDRYVCTAGESRLELQFNVVGVGVVEPWTAADEPPRDLGPVRAAAWERIKAERDRRKVLGVKVGAHWFHSDDSSRIQQLALMMMGASIPPGLQWKTLTTTPPPVFVTMTQALATGIFQATAASDAAIFAACEVHRVAMEASATPEAYDFSGGWPASIEDGV
ncbi:hypothetical protein PMI14_01330 [Acidovorax sp. CF316]|nr:hypothetical protein PMI14_01330 [Acidovorax sp. CF316]